MNRLDLLRKYNMIYLEDNVACRLRAAQVEVQLLNVRSQSISVKFREHSVKFREHPVNFREHLVHFMWHWTHLPEIREKNLITLPCLFYPGGGLLFMRIPDIARRLRIHTDSHTDSHIHAQIHRITHRLAHQTPRVHSSLSFSRVPGRSKRGTGRPPD
jgi:hypothetical protein